MRILVTGGLGFVGQHLLRHLLVQHRDAHLTVIDNLSSSRIDHAWLLGRAEILIDDFAALPARQRFDQIYHLASPVGSLGILAMSGHVAKAIVDLAVRAGEWAAASGASLLYVSSSEVYGKGGEQDERDELAVPVQIGTRMEYSLGKVAGEHVLRNMAARHGFRLTIARPFNALGEHQSSRIGFVVPTFFEHAMAGRALPLFHGGQQVRCFCHVDDLVRGLIAMQQHGANGQTYNVGNPGNAISIRELAVKIRALCRSSSALECVDPSARFGCAYIEASAKSPSIDKLHADTGWWPAIDLDGALQRVHRSYLTMGASVHAEHADRVAEA
jgi:nucleoside-diphosphate-sugar epimerase